MLTGETGAGKSILLDALGLALGGRGETVPGASRRDSGVVTATFDPPTGRSRRCWRTTAVDIEPGEPLLVRRIVKADGGSRGFVNNQPAAAALLREMAPMLVEIHGQHDDRGLLNPRGHRALLDAFGRVDPGDTARAWATLRAAETELARRACRDRDRRA